MINTLPFNFRWNKLVQKPFEEGDERGLKLVQSILKTIMLRRTKSSTDREGRWVIRSYHILVVHFFYLYLSNVVFLGFTLCLLAADLF